MCPFASDPRFPLSVVVVTKSRKHIITDEQVMDVLSLPEAASDTVGLDLGMNLLDMVVSVAVLPSTWWLAHKSLR